MARTISNSNDENNSDRCKDPYVIPGAATYCPQFDFRFGKRKARHTKDILSDPSIAGTGLISKTLTKKPWVRVDEKCFPEGLYYVPGYTGYCPGRQYWLGKTYGHNTRDQILESKRKDPNFVSRLEIPSDIEPLPNSKFQPGEPSNQRYFGDQVPGYTGYIPGNQHCIGMSYAPMVGRAMGRFQKEQLRRDQTPRSFPYDVTELPPMQPVVNGNDLDIWQSQHQAPPVDMSTYVHGYTGYVPNERFTYGTRKPAASEQCMKKFKEDTENHKAQMLAPVEIELPPRVDKKSSTIYVKDQPLKLHYTGHIPGHQYRIGMSRERSSLNAKQKMIAENETRSSRAAPAVQPIQLPRNFASARKVYHANKGCWDSNIPPGANVNNRIQSYAPETLRML